MIKDYSVFIISYNRADNLVTFGTLRKHGYTGKIYIVVSDNDPQLQLYKEKYENILVFNKLQFYKNSNIDLCDNFEKLNNAVIPKTFVLDYARKNNLVNIIILDDDISSIRYRYERNGQLLGCIVKDLDSVFSEFVNYLNCSDSIACLSFGNAGGYIGGCGGKFSREIGRTVNQVFIIKMSDDIKFTGTRNHDDNFANILSINGKICMEIYSICQYSPERGTNKGGLDYSANDINIYVSNFYSIMQNPSYNIIGRRYSLFRNLKCAYPMIVSGRYKK